MKKLMPILRLVCFCAAIFAITWGALLVRDGRLLAHKGEGGAEATKGGDKSRDSEPVKSSMPLMPSTEGTSREETTAPPANSEDGARRGGNPDSALKSGRALFEVPAPYSIAELSELLNDLQTVKAENEKRKNDLDQREKRLVSFEAEINARRNEVFEALQKLPTNAGAGKPGEPVVDADPEVLKRFAKILGACEPEMAMKALKGRPPDQIAQVLLEMEKEDQVWKILQKFDELELKQVSEAFFRVRKAGSGE